MPDAKASGASASSGSAPHNRAHNQGNQERKYTVEQKAAVLRIRACKPTAFYEILAVEKSCSDADVKKAYRKQSLLTHPDKNGHEHADEAFKMVSRAFSVLGDKEKREKYDRFGTDPDSRFESARQQNPFAGGGFGGGGRAARGGGGWEDEISPEEMFARFFGGGGFGGPFGGGAFDTGPQFVFNFGGGPGVRVHQFGGARPRRRPRDPNQPQPETSLTSTIMGLLPILLLFIFPLLSSIFGGDSTPAVPNMAFDFPQPPVYTAERTMPNLHVKYFVDPRDISGYSNYKLAQLDKTAEVNFVRRLKMECDNEVLMQRRLEQEARGWIYQDPVKMEVARNMDMPACRRIQSLGIVF
ncbi:DUF1977-domain-containing protein [Coniochaeta hoffmannii]|uniref:DUF1977-domain-containing protein n=1 Tax=Coniochaeta hoffmannii TaxID=91930 RepID=A0AA38VDX8_9PEZI|nr:DUF1977-domain-containing protein [Coniochaeta hoffmannii]